MLPILVVMVLILALAGLIMAYVAYPHRGQQMPKGEWVAEAMRRAAESAPVIDRDARQPEADVSAPARMRGSVAMMDPDATQPLSQTS